MSEVMANPDGVDKTEEYVEIVNLGNGPADVSGWTLGDVYSPTRHVFVAGTVLGPHTALVVHGGPSATGLARLLASSGQLSLNNDTETLTLRNAEGGVVDQVVLGVAVSGEAVHRSEDGLADLDFDGRLDGGAWGQHAALSPAGLRSSPGLRVTGAPWDAVVPEPGDEEPPPQSGVDEVHLASALPNPVASDRPEEYVTIVNLGLVAVDLSGWAIGDLVSPHRHVFPSGTLLGAGASLKIYDGGTHADGLPASSGALSLNNDVETVTLYDAHAAVVSALSWTSAAEGEVVTAPAAE
jgi:hypothetical protein